jgi:ubiquinone/menaquinone biosynthesis C-methylase UbiE
MKRIAFSVAALVALVSAAGAAAWLRERGKRRAFPASDAQALLNPLRRWIQPPDETVRAFGIQPGDRVLELGPGPGYFTAGAAAAVGPSGRIIAADLQREMLVALRDRIDAPVDLIVAEAAHLPFRAGALDTAFLVSMLGEVPDPAHALHEVARVLRPGGVVSFSETMNDPDYVRLASLARLCAAAGLEPLRRRRQILGYIARFARPAAAWRAARSALDPPPSGAA